MRAEGNPASMPMMIKPRTLGVLAKAERRKVGASYIVTALGLFDLARPDADRFETDQALWLLAAKALPKGSVIDVGMPKPRAELLIGGAARAPTGQPATAMAVEWAVGPLRKRLVAFGDRYWQIADGGVAATSPRPFTEIPLSPERAFGGAGFADNPGGLGYRTIERIRAGELVALPNIENADQLVLAPESRPAPALCGPMDMASPKRRRYAGTYDGHWLKHVAPALPDDVDPRLFLTAPEDQVFPDFLHGGEPYALRGFSADEPELRGALPAFRVRCFLARKGKGEAPDELVEMEMRTDTLWLFAGARRGVLIYRGALPVNDIDAEDLSAVMLAYERASDEPRSFESYVEVWKLRRDRASAVKWAFAEGQLAPALSPEIVERRNAERAALTRRLLDKHLEGQAWAFNRRLDEAGVPELVRPAAPKAELDEELLNLYLPTPEELEEGEIDLAAILDGIAAIEKKTREKVEELEGKADSIKKSVDALRAPGSGPDEVDLLFAALDQLSGGETAKGLDEAFGGIETSPPSLTAAAEPEPEPGDALKRVKDWRRLILDGMRDVPDDEVEFLAARARFLELPEGKPLFEVRKAMEAARTNVPEAPSFEPAAAPGAAPAPEPPRRVSIEALLDDIGREPTGAGSPPTTAAQAPDIGAKRGQIGDQIREAFPNLPQDGGSALDSLLAALESKPDAESTTPADPAGRMRQNVEKQKAKLDETISSLDEQEAEMMKGLTVIRQKTPAPSYPQKSMSRALARRFGELVATEYRNGLSLARRDLAGADLRGVDLAGADMEGALLERADLSGARLAGARLQNAALAGATLDGADFSDVDLSGANLAKCHATKTDFSRCRFADSFVLEADFSGSKFEGARLEKMQIVKCKFDDADLSEAAINLSSVMQTSLARTMWNRASLEASSFIDVRLDAAHFRGAKLFRCVFLKAPAAASDFEDAEITRSSFIGEVDLANARFARATGSDFTLHEVNLSRADFSAATFKRATFVKSDFTGANFRLASLKGALFGGARLAGADFVGANLLGAQLRRADLSGARMNGANLYSADLDHTIFTAADLTGANLDKTYLAVDTNVG